MLRFFNTLSRQVEEFQPLEPGKVRMYICGPTVWNFAHIGNFRTFIFGDILRRYLKFKGSELTHVMNLTDIDDRIINEAAARNITINEFTEPYTQYFLEDFDALGNERPEIMPRATDHIPEMIDIISTLLANGHAYESDGSIYYRITAFPEYGKLSKISFEGNIAGGSERVDTDKYDKEDARDFALWKLVGPTDEPGWDAPFGRGRPGWHIECSAMSMKYLGETFDLHAGGQDLQFPHHENEIAQSEGATGKLFAKYWIHSEFLKIDDVTMSKSKGNFFTFRDLREQGYSALAIRYVLLSVPYRKQLNFTFEGLQGAESTVERLEDFRRSVRTNALGGEPTHWIKVAGAQALEEFAAAMDDDLNTAEALAIVHIYINGLFAHVKKERLSVTDQRSILSILSKFNKVLGIWKGPTRRSKKAHFVNGLVMQRQDAKSRRDFATADAIRDLLTADGVIVEDTPFGPRWTFDKEIQHVERTITRLLKRLRGRPLPVIDPTTQVHSVKVPRFRKIEREVTLGERFRTDLVIADDEQTWFIEIKHGNGLNLGSKAVQHLMDFNSYIQNLDPNNRQQRYKLWLIATGPVVEETVNRLRSEGLLVTTARELLFLEKSYV